MADFDVIRVGTDTSGRKILMTAYMAAWWARVVAELGFRPTIVQGAFMARVPGGGAADSEGYHDAGGCLDLRTWDLTPDQSERLVRTLRNFGAAAWRRDERHGMDPHLHFVLGTDKPMTPGAWEQWRDYLTGHDGLSGNGPDYEWRPNPIVTTPPEEDEMKEADWKRMEGLVRAAVKAELDEPRDVSKPGEPQKRSLAQMVVESWRKR